MSEFKFACPICGQHITADSKDTGSQIPCPTCFRKIVVPQAPATTDPKFVLSASEANKPRPQVTAPQLEPIKPTAGKPALPVALIILLVLACGAGATLVLLRGKIFKSSSTTSQTEQPTAKSNAPSATQSVQIETPDTNSLWTLDPTNAIPDAPAMGRIHRRAFTCDRATLQGGRLTLRAGRSGPIELAVDVYFFTKEPEELVGRNAEIKPTDTKAPRVSVRWKEGDKVTSESFRNAGYAMKVEFGSASGGRLPGKVFIALPDESKSWVAGTFTAEMKKASPPKPKPPTQ